MDIYGRDAKTTTHRLQGRDRAFGKRAVMSVAWDAGRLITKIGSRMSHQAESYSQTIRLRLRFVESVPA